MYNKLYQIPNFSNNPFYENKIPKNKAFKIFQQACSKACIVYNNLKQFIEKW